MWKKVDVLLVMTFLIGVPQVRGFTTDKIVRSTDSIMQVVHIPKDAILTDFMGDDIVNTHYIIQHEHIINKASETLTIGNNCILEFEDGSLNSGRLKCSSIVIKGKNPTFVDTYIEISDADCVVIKNVSAKYSFAVDDFVRIKNSQNIVVDAVKVEFDEGNKQLPNGVYIEAEGFDLTNCENVSFVNSSIINSKSHYIDSNHGSLICKNCSNIVLDGCFSSGGHNETFNFIGCEKVTIKNTLIEGGCGSAIATQGGEDFTIDNCKSYNVGASGFSFNSRKIRIKNCIAKDWHVFNGITLGHPADNMQADDIIVTDCEMILTNNIDSHRKCALGGVIDGHVVVVNCKMKISRLCSFDGNRNSKAVSLTFVNNDIVFFAGDSFANFFRASNIYNLEISENTFTGNAVIPLLGFSVKDLQAGTRKMIIRNNVFKGGADIKDKIELKYVKNVVFEGNLKEE